MSETVIELPSVSGSRGSPRDPGQGLGSLPEERRRDPRGARVAARHARHPGDARAIPARALRGDGGLRRRPQARDDASRRRATSRRGQPFAQIVEGPIAFSALCEHHALPFFGHAHVGYIAGERIIGISKLTRLVRLFARRFTVQERLGEQIADTLEQLVGPRGVAVRLEASHLCTQMRGVEERSRTTTTAWRGVYRDAQLRREFLDLTR